MDVYKLSHDLTKRIYELQKKFPKEEIYGLVAQLRRSSSSIVANLIEGNYRFSKKEFKHFISISRGSCAELRYLIFLSYELGYLNEDEYQTLLRVCERIISMLTKLYNSF
ncbi:small subunit ribosomal protein S23e [Deferribacter desulfuricans SSM1]|uniref:Small subunit ribosomal protein S23e n=2 Tax=Deferribacter TaxID=53572 RepID=D3PCQ3_DEFDS|nr:small subunit ribosomal protein S23e [Deferribacter desulfuricans SSM1]